MSVRSFIERIRFVFWFRKVQQHLVVLLDDKVWWQYEVAVVEHHRREFADLWLAGIDPWTAAENYYRELMVGEWACLLTATHLGQASVWPCSTQTQSGQTSPLWRGAARIRLWWECMVGFMVVASK